MLPNNSQPIDLSNEEVTLEYGNGHPSEPVTAYLLRLYPERLNGYDAYVDTQFNLKGLKFIENIEIVISSRLKKRWKVIGKPQESPIAGLSQDGKSMLGLAPSWRFGLQEV